VTSATASSSTAAVSHTGNVNTVNAGHRATGASVLWFLVLALATTLF
jgi:hypothetical protein